MSTARQRSRRTDSIRNEEKVRNAAETVFARLGDRLSMDDVAVEAGVSKGTVYFSYPTRERLIEEMTIRVFERSTQAMRAAAASDDPWTGLVEAVVTETLGVAYRTEISDPQAPLTPSRAAYLECEQALNDLLDMLKAKGMVRPEIAARHLAVLFRGLYLVLPPYSERTAAEAGEYARIILRGIRTDL